MITVNNLIDQLLHLKKIGYSDYPIIYASDNEGNEYQLVNNLPTPFAVEDLSKNHLQPVSYKKLTDNNFSNCVIIN